MRRVVPAPDWPASWLQSYEFDLLEIYGSASQPGYSYAYESRQKWTLKLVERVSAPGARVLDVAAGQGNFSLLLAERGYQVTWNDIREELAGYVALKQEAPLDFAPGNVFDLALEGQFDVVVITECIEHVAHPDQFLAQIATLVKPGGHIVMTTPNGQYFRNRLPKFSNCADPSVYESQQFQPDSDGHIFLLHLHEVYKFAEQAGLKVEDVRFLTTPLTSGHMKMGRLLKWLPKRFVDTVEQSAQLLPTCIKKVLLIQMAVLFSKR